MQVLRDGSVLLGYGSAPILTQFSRKGEVLCDFSFGALHWKDTHEFSPGAVMSYRAYRQSWKGWPIEYPQVRFADDHFYVVWNGATEVYWWRLEGSEVAIWRSKEKDWHLIGEVQWSGFESNITTATSVTDEKAHLVYRLTALDKNNKTLGVWVVNTGAVVMVSGTVFR